MAGISEKLYPPIINGSLPAFYDENGTARIVVPFSMNRAVNLRDIGGFKLKIKTVQSNTLITTLDSTDVESASVSVANKKVAFNWANFNNSNSKQIKIGQYLKVQLAYIKTTGEVGYFSTVGIIKYTTKPNVYIAGLKENYSSIYRANYVGVFEPGEDKSERPYSYCFSLLDSYGNIVETTGWTLHNTSINNVSSESLSLDQTTDNYSFNTALTVDRDYFVKYSVRTINNLEVSSPMYAIQEIDVGDPDINLSLRAENMFDDGYIKLSFDLAEGAQIDDILESPVSIEICRAEKTDNFSSWITLTRAYISSYLYAVTEWYFEDFTVEQGIVYRYCFKQYNAAGIQSSRIVSHDVLCDFEDMFLCDSDHKQLKIRFNPKVSSFKTTRLETKTDTIGSRYPFIFRNGVVGYKEFPIAGLISYLTDDNELFLKHKDDLHILSGVDSERLGNPVDQDQDDTDLGKSWEISQTLDSTGYNIRAERRFKLKVLDWLGDGKIKLFRSPTEGNYLIRLMNISFSPEDKLGRMLHNFTSTAYEVEEYNYNNLLELGFFNMPTTIITNIGTKSVKLTDILEDSENYKAFKINQEPIIKYAKIELSPQGTPFYIKIGTEDTLISTNGQAFGFMERQEYHLSDFFFDIASGDNLDRIGQIHNTTVTSNTVTKEQIIDLIQDAVLTYAYEDKEVAVGEFHNIVNAYLQTVIKTYIGYGQNGTSVLFAYSDSGATEIREIVKFYSIKFRAKNTRVITITNGSYYNEDNSLLSSDSNFLSTNNFDPTTIYHIVNTDNNTEYYKCGNAEGELIDCYSNTNIVLTFENDEEPVEVTFEQEPVFVDLAERGVLLSMTIGDAIFAECAYQEKVIEKE